ncbi:MAG: sigma-54-dependent Fis family transcriptional regulator, partial [Candidatus Cloacimonadota bacterium]
YLYKEDVELAEIEIIKDKITTKLKESVEKLINNTNIKAQPFLYARCLVLLSDIKLREFNKTKEKKCLFESINYLKETKKILEKMEAEPFIAKLNTKFLKLIDEFIHYEAKEPRKDRYLVILKELGKTIKNINNPEELKERFLAMAKKLTGAERGLFLTLDPDTDDFIITGKDMDKATITDAKKFSRSVIKRVKRTKRPLISYDAVQDRRFRKSESVLINDIHSILCIPVINEDKILGTLYLDSRKKPGLFSKEDKDFFSSLSNLLAGTLEKALEFRNIKEETILLKKHLRARFGPKNIIGKSGKMQEVFDKIKKAAKIDIPVLILGDTGTGKELVAATIHQLSKRKTNTFSIVDCLALSTSLLESELFGHTKGAFTGADREKIGLLEASMEGSTFIDEIGDASYAVQSNLLRFLDTGEVKKIGATKYHKVDTRIIAASNKDIYQLVAEGKFREDLFYRMNKFVIQLPSLRERKEDIKLLLEYFLALFNRKYNKEIKGLTKDAFELLFNYDWPGNVREFESEIERCVLFCNKNLITKEFLSPRISRLPLHFLPLKEIEKTSRFEYVQNVLEFTGGNVTKTAKILEIDRKTIQRMLKKHKS